MQRLMLSPPRYSLVHSKYSSNPSSFIRYRFHSTSTTSTPTLSWSQFLAARQSKRRYGLFLSIPSLFLGFTLGMNYFATIETEPGTTLLGMEPVVVYGAAAAGCAAAGWLLAPVVSNSVWNLLNRRTVQAMELKEKEFYRHLLKNRVDGSRQRVANPIPDFYGEKIGSLKEYRTWLRNQNNYRRKISFGEAE